MANLSNFNRSQPNNFLNHNRLLRNNSNNLHSSANITQQQISQIQQQKIQEIKNLQNVKKIERMNNLDKNKIKECVIRPIKVKVDNTEINENWEKFVKLDPYNANQTKNNIVKELWDKRNNQPYKNIIKDEKHIEKFIKMTKPKSTSDKDIKLLEKEFIVHRVTNDDKKGVDEELNELTNKIVKHDKELCDIYSVSKEAEYKKKFEYNKQYRERIKFDPTNRDHDDLKNDSTYHLKKQQDKIDENINDKQKIIGTLRELNIFTDDEINQCFQNDSKKIDNETSISKNISTSYKTDEIPNPDSKVNTQNVQNIQTCKTAINKADYRTRMMMRPTHAKKSEQNTKDDLKNKYRTRQKSNKIIV